MKWTLILLSVLALASCKKREVFGAPNNYVDDFEVYSWKEDLIDRNDELWTFFQLIDDLNTITIESTIVHFGNKSVRFFAVDGSSDDAKKCSINKQFMAFWE